MLTQLASMLTELVTWAGQPFELLEWQAGLDADGAGQPEWGRFSRLPKWFIY